MATAEAELRAQIDATRRQVAETPAVQVVANHAIGLFELAAIHLGTQPPHLPDAALAIDALGALVEGLGGRLGESEPALRDALGADPPRLRSGQSVPQLSHRHGRS